MRTLVLSLALLIGTPVLADCCDGPVFKDPRLSTPEGIGCPTAVEKVPSRELIRINGTKQPAAWKKQRDRDLLRCLDAGGPAKWDPHYPS